MPTWWLIILVEVCASAAQFRFPSYNSRMLDKRLLLVFFAAATPRIRHCDDGTWCLRGTRKFQIGLRGGLLRLSIEALSQSIEIDNDGRSLHAAEFIEQRGIREQRVLIPVSAIAAMYVSKYM